MGCKKVMVVAGSFADTEARMLAWLEQQGHGPRGYDPYNSANTLRANPHGDPIDFDSTSEYDANRKLQLGVK